MSHIKVIPQQVCIFGSGNFGSCLADHLADATHNVLLWSRSASVVAALNSTHTHPSCHAGHVFPAAVQAIGPDLPAREVLLGMDVLVFAVPTEGLRKTLEKLRPLLSLDTVESARDPLLIFVNKGIESGTHSLTLEIVAETLGKGAARTAVFLSGPSFASEIVQRQPTNVSVTSFSSSHADRTATLFHQPWFRCYTGKDPIGVELAGALKNVYAIAAGTAHGLGYGDNTRAGLITRALAEMSRIGTAYGASPLTFLTLAGVGDLFLTCSSRTSRNFTVGHRLGRGEQLEDILASLGSVAEGVATAMGAKALIEKLGVQAPIAMGVYEVLHEGAPVKEQARRLMERPAAAEIDLPQEMGATARDLLRKIGVDEV